MKLRAVQAALVLIVQLSLIISAQTCTTPPAPSEVREALAQEQDLWRAGASFFAPAEYENYRKMLAEARRVYEKEELKVGYFRDYARVKQEFSRVLQEGERIQKLIASKKASLSEEILAEKKVLYSRYEMLDALSLELSQRNFSRQHLAQADIMFKEVDRLVAQTKYEEARAKLKAISSLLNQAESILKKQLERYMNQGQIAYWRRLAERAIEKSKATGETVILVSKLERKLTVYKAGIPVKTYEVGLGFNGLSDKLHAGDDATPEGEYRVIKKIASSKFGKALLINYPNEEDIRKFNEAKKRGYITPSTKIGGLIEIHGGGKDGLTKGCVALDDKEMEELYRQIPVGTQVTIVGTTDPNNKIIAILKRENK
ncbi:MAG: L,D-transpeptidase [Candidatus Aminicenantes bacterium]|nr:L,D-transpeptidase [Candidatus Aminicenantes bacterium]